MSGQIYSTKRNGWLGRPVGKPNGRVAMRRDGQKYQLTVKHIVEEVWGK